MRIILGNGNKNQFAESSSTGGVVDLIFKAYKKKNNIDVEVQWSNGTYKNNDERSFSGKDKFRAIKRWVSSICKQVGCRPGSWRPVQQEKS